MVVKSSTTVCGHLFSYKSACLQFKSRQGAGTNRNHVGSKAQRFLNRAADALAKLLSGSVTHLCGRLEFQGHLRQRAVFVNGQAKFCQFRKSPQYRFYRGREYVVAPHDEHVIHATEDAPFQSRKRPPADTLAARETDLVPCAI